MRLKSLWVVGVLAACGGGSGGSDPTADAPGSLDGTGGAADADPIAGALDGLRWDLPCLADTTPELCTTSPTVSSSATLAGDAATTYDVTLRFRGVVEPKTYTGGTRDEWFQTGGTPAGDTANIYRLVVSAPEATYYVNAGTTRASTDLFCATFDYEATIPIAGGATVTLEAESLDDLQIQNRDEAGAPYVIADVPPAPAPFDGQFVQMDVVSVSAI